MLIVRDPEDASRIANPYIRALLDLRLRQLGTFHDGLLLVVETGDSVEELEAVSGAAILHDPFEDVPFGHPDFTPSFDFVINHNGAYEMHFDASDDGIGATLFIPKGEGIDAGLLDLCREFAVAER